ncbi:MAG: RNA pseudouridine synthase [Labilithrix sp.]|nr:RNA pseudouridine synthase [Labilithrix sp.]
MRGRPREKVWVVRPGDGRTVADIVRRAGEDATAVDEGRVFVGKKRATRGDAPVRAGDAVRIGPRRAAASSEGAPDVTILFDEGGLVACVKPAGLPTVPDHAGSAHALVAVVARSLRRKTDELRVTSRLDRDVSGVVIFALDPAAEERLRAARAEGRYERRYLALAATGEHVLGDAGVWDAPIGRAADARLRAARGPDAKEAATRWRKIATAPLASAPGAPPTSDAPSRDGGAPPREVVAMLAVDPVTGRTHQIRVHASDAGAPLVGDRDYGGPGRIVLTNGRILAPARVALHAARVVVPGERGLVEARAPVPAELTETWRALGGDDEAWERALASATPELGAWRRGAGVE